MKAIIIVVFVFAAFVVGGCSNAANNPVASVQPEGDREVPTEQSQVVGRWEYRSNDGATESGILVKDAEGHLIPLSDRQSAVETNWWFKIDVEYFDHHGLILIDGKYLPIYMRGDRVRYDFTLNYNGRLPLDIYPFLYAKLNVVHQDKDGVILNGSEWNENPLLLSPKSEVVLHGAMMVPTNLYPQMQIIQMETTLTCTFYEGQFTIFIFKPAIGGFFFS